VLLNKEEDRIIFHSLLDIHCLGQLCYYKTRIFKLYHSSHMYRKQ